MSEQSDRHDEWYRDSTSERDIGRLQGAVEAISKDLNRLHDTLAEHIADEDGKLEHIEQQLSLGRFILLTVKTVGLTVIAVLTFKFGDITALWKTLFK